MALTLVASTLYKAVGATDTFVTATIDGSGSDRLIVVVIRGRGSSIRTVTDITLDAVSGSTPVVNNFDNAGVATYGGHCFFTDAQNPGAGPFTIGSTWSGSVNNLIFEVYEFTGADQSTPISAQATATSSSVTDSTAMSDVTLASQSGEYAIVYASSADSSSASASGGHTVDADATILDQDFNDRNRAAFANDVVVASASVAYTWTMSHNGTDAMDNTVAGAFAVFAAAAVGPVITGPSSVTDGTPYTLTGTDLDTLASTGDVALITTAGGFSKVQTYGTVTPTSIPTVQGISGKDIGTYPASGVPVDTTINAAGITAWQLQQEVDDGVNPADAFNIDFPVASTLQAVQTMIAVADTTAGESMFGTDLLVVEDNHQLVIPKVVDGVTLNIIAEGRITWLTSELDAAGGQIVFDALYFAPSTGNWTKLETTIEESPTFIPSADVTPTEAMVNYLRAQGFTGGAADLQLQWLVDLGFTTGSVSDRWKAMMDGDAIAPGGVSNRKRAFYEAVVGASPFASINELKRAYWLSL